MGRVGFNLRRFLAGALCILTSGLLSGAAQAQTNSWTNPNNGKWENSANWSSGFAPSISDVADLITNSGGEIVTIDATTVLSNTLDGCLTISNLTVSAPDAATNTLFLNNAGLVTPLSVLDTLDVDTNGAVVVNSSILQVSNTLFVGEYGYNGTLTITNGGQVYSGSGYLGGYEGHVSPSVSTNNVLTVTGSSSVWSNSGTLSVGDDSETPSYNSLVIANGGAVYDTGANLVGVTSSVLVIGERSVWDNNGDLVLAGC
jgi:T5SS/PEP-CTERM-associated repeat protein